MAPSSDADLAEFDIPDASIPGAFPHDTDSAQQTLSQAVYARRAEYTKQKTIRVKIGTWNVGNHDGARDIGAWLVDGKGTVPDISGLGVENGESEAKNKDTEDVKDQEARQRTLSKRVPTVPIGDDGAVPSGTEIGLYVLGLQEIVDIGSPAEALRPYTDPTAASKYKDAVQESLPAGYQLVAEQQLIGLLILIYAAPDILPDIRSVSTTSVGTGLMGYMGNKGAVTARVLLGETTRLLFVNSHLAAGADKAALDRRNWDAGQINTRTRFEALDDPAGVTTAGSEGIGDEDIAFWFGDLNYRLEGIPGDDVRRLLMFHTSNKYADDQATSSEGPDKTTTHPENERTGHSADKFGTPQAGGITATTSDSSVVSSRKSEDYQLPDELDPGSMLTTLSSLLPHDELAQQMRSRKAFHDGWKEGPIRFLPTYKYDVGTVGVFDSSEKRRSPSWCDRVLYRTRNDYLGWKKKLKEEEDARNRDEELKARGVEEDENVIFDYNPEEDADDFQDISTPQPETVQTRNGNEDELLLEYYTSHQRVLSSDHKPLDAVFSLTYASAIPDLKAQIHAEVAKELDKKENERRPTVTVVVDKATTDDSDSAEEEVNAMEIVDFGSVRFGKGKHRQVTVANTGQAPATLSFVDRPGKDLELDGAFPSWLIVKFDRDPDPKDKKANKSDPPTYTLLPGDAVNMELTARVEALDLAKDITDGIVQLEDVLILRVKDGRDHFIPIQGKLVRSGFDRSVDKLKSLPEDGFRKLQGQKPTTSPKSIRSLWGSGGSTS